MKVTAGVKLRRLNGRFAAGTFAPILLEARARIRQDVERAFDQRADPQTGQPWKDRQTRRAREYLHPLLVKTGKLKREAIAAAASAVVSGNRLTVTQRVPSYAGFHQLGTRVMVARRYQGVTRATRLWLARRMKDQAVRVWRDRNRGSY